MDLLGEHLGVYQTRSNNIKYTVSWNAGVDRSDGPNEISIGYGKNGVFLDGSEIGEKLNAVYRPATATIAACLVWSEVLRRSGAYLPIEIPKVSVSLNVRVNENALYTMQHNLTFL